MRAIRVGISGPRGDAVDWFDAFDAVELQASGRTRPTPSAAHAWRQAAPSRFEFILRAPPFIGQHLVAPKRGGDAAVRRVWKETDELARALHASLVIVPTPASFRASDEHAARLTTFFGWAHRHRLRLAWEHRHDGWPIERTADLCRELSLTHVVDPLVGPPARGRPPCYRLNGVDGAGHRYSDDELAEVVRLCDVYGDGHPMYDEDRAYCLFGNGSRWEDAVRLRHRLAEDGVRRCGREAASSD